MAVRYECDRCEELCPPGAYVNICITKYLVVEIKETELQLCHKCYEEGKLNAEAKAQNAPPCDTAPVRDEHLFAGEGSPELVHGRRGTGSPPISEEAPEKRDATPSYSSKKKPRK